MVNRIMILAVLASLLMGCKEEMEFPFPKDFLVVITGDYIRIGNDEVILKGNVKIPASLSKTNPGIEYGFFATSQWYTDTIILGTTNESINFDQRLTKRHITDVVTEIVAFARHDSIVYHGNLITIDFKGVPYIIHNIIPDKGIWQDTVMITGTRLDGYPDKTHVYFVKSQHGHSWNSIKANIISVDSGVVMVAVPRITHDGPFDIVIDIASQLVRIDNRFQIARPEITGFYPEYGFDGDTITITGKHFGHFFDSANQSNNSVTFAGEVLPVVSWNNNKIEAVLNGIPLRQENHFTVNYLDTEGTSQNTFYFINPWRELSHLPNANEVSTCRGFSLEGFGIVGNNSIFWKYNPATNMWFQLPGIESVSSYPSPWVINNRAYLVNTTSGYGPRIYNIFEFIPEGNWGQWQNLGTTNLPDYFQTGHTSIVMQNRAFLLTGNSEDATATNFFEILPDNNLWTPAPQFPGGPLSFTFSMEIKGMAYFGTGLKSGNSSDLFYRYDPIAQTWTKMADFPIKSFNGIGFSLNEIGYAGLGNTHSGSYFDRGIYTYNPQLNAWKWVADFPLSYSGVAHRNAFVFTIENIAYIGTTRYNNNNFFEFDPAYLKENYQHNNPKTKPE